MQSYRDNRDQTQTLAAPSIKNINKNYRLISSTMRSKVPPNLGTSLVRKCFEPLKLFLHDDRLASKQLFVNA